MRRQRLVTRVHELGPRALFELLNEIEKYGVADLDHRLAKYADIDVELLRWLGADRFPPPPIHLVR
jgi:hypothetical protein